MFGAEDGTKNIFLSLLFDLVSDKISLCVVNLEAVIHCVIWNLNTTLQGITKENTVLQRKHGYRPNKYLYLFLVSRDMCFFCIHVL